MVGRSTGRSAARTGNSVRVYRAAESDFQEIGTKKKKKSQERTNPYPTAGRPGRFTRQSAVEAEPDSTWR